MYTPGLMQETLTRYVSNEQLSESLPCVVGASKQNVIRTLLFHLARSIVSTQLAYSSGTVSERESIARFFYRVYRDIKVRFATTAIG
jgi:hypothetical protein